MGFEAIHIGVDPGKIHDPAAIAVMHVTERPSPYGAETVYQAQLAERVPLGTSYPDLAQILVKLLVSIYEREARLRLNRVHVPSDLASPDIPQRYLYVDATGVGEAFCDILRPMLSVDNRTNRIWLQPVKFRAGQKYDPSTGMMGKAAMVNRLQVLMQRRPPCLGIDRKVCPEADDVKAEILNFDADTNQDGHTSFGAKPGKHDDMVCAVGLACLEDPADYAVRTIHKSEWGGMPW